MFVVFLITTALALEPTTNIELAPTLLESEKAPQCATEGSNCPLYTGTAPTIVQYGAESKYSMLIAQAGRWDVSVPCTNAVFSDPDKGAKKACFRTLLDLSSPGLRWPSNWTYLAEENDIVQVFCPTWVRFGGQDRFIYQIQSGSFPCTASTFHWDIPVDGNGRRCDVGDRCVASLEMLEECATQDNPCDLTAATSLNKWVFFTSRGRSLVRQFSAPSISCSATVFGEPDSDHTKTCLFLSTPPFVEPTGEWSLAASAPGVSYNLQQSVTRTSSETKQSTWGMELTTTVAKDFAWGTAEISASAKYEESKAVEHTLSLGTSTACGVTCPKKYPFLYQWQLTAKELCTLSGQYCNLEVKACHYYCRADATPPACHFTACDITRSSDCSVCKAT
jgi:hypothetical protein